MSINSIKLELAEAIELYDHLKLRLNDQGDLDSPTEIEWQSRIRNLGLDAAKLIQTSRVLDDDRLLNVIKSKEKKLVRHSKWAKRHKKRVQQKRKQIQKRSEDWIKEAEWKVTIAPSATTTSLSKITPSETTSKEKEDESIKLKLRITELSRIMSKLTKLRDLRRKKLESKGHFFVEYGNQFYDQVKKWHESNQIEQEQKEKDDIYESVDMKKSKELVIHKEDTWKNIPIDERAYSYWCESDQSLEALLKNRRMWDQYIVYNSQDDDPIHKVPPTFVNPAPPANWVWASYLS